jgi:hypothetical protein
MEMTKTCVPIVAVSLEICNTAGTVHEKISFAGRRRQVQEDISPGAVRFSWCHATRDMQTTGRPVLRAVTP